MFSSRSYPQKTFCEGWEDGYEKGMEFQNENAYITPFCPIIVRGKETYENGFEQGFEKATGKKTLILFKAEDGKESFCDGWERGYTHVMNKNNRTTFMVPMCPIARINADSYEAGFIRGSLKADRKLNANETSSFTQVNSEGTFCEGWEKGYRMGLQIWAEANDEDVPLKFTPFCPIARINQDQYIHGFERGKKRAFEDMN
jgi:hypothetical protein